MGWRKNLLRVWDGRPGASLPLPELQLKPPPWKRAENLPSSSRVIAALPAEPARKPMLPVQYGVRKPLQTHPRLPEMIAAPALQLRELRDAVVMRGNIVLSAQTSELLPPTFLVRNWSGTNSLARDENGDFSPHRPINTDDVEVIDRPALLADTDTTQTYGHVLMQVMPQLWALRHLPRETPIVTSVELTDNYLKLFAALGVPRQRIISSRERPLRFRKLFAADVAVELLRYVHPIALETFAKLRRLSEQSRIERHKRIYVSRRGVDRRPLRNEAEIEALFTAKGFVSVAPESLATEDQIALFASAEMIAGPGGSAMLNTVFSLPTTRVLILAYRRMFVPLDVMLPRPAGQLGYVFGSKIEAEEQSRARYLADWDIDPGNVASAIHQHFGL